MKIIETLSCRYSLDNSCLVLSDEYPCGRISVVFQDFVSFCIGQISDQQHKGKKIPVDVSMLEFQFCTSLQILVMFHHLSSIYLILPLLELHHIQHIGWYIEGNVSVSGDGEPSLPCMVHGLCLPDLLS